MSVRPSASHTSVRFSFPGDNLSKHLRIFTKLGMCIDMEIWFEIANGQISSNLYGVICPRHDNGGVLQFYLFIYFARTSQRLVLQAPVTSRYSITVTQ